MTFAIPAADRKLRLGMVGGGRAGNIGRTHRSGALMEGKWDVVAGALSRDPDRAALSAQDWLIAPDRAYTDWREMARAEAGRADGIDAVAICTWNDTHYEIACAFMDAGIHIICDKPLTTSIEKAVDLVRRADDAGIVFAVTHGFAAYPMPRLARDMIAAGELGQVRSVVVEYASQYQSEFDGTDDWQNDPVRSGPLGIIAGTGTHAHHLAEFVTGLEVTELSADLATLVPGHLLEDHATLHLHMSNGARGLLWNTTIAPGCENGLSIRVFGSRGGIEWHQEHPNHMYFTPTGGQKRIISRGGPGMTTGALHGSHVPAGHPEGYLEGFANIYSEVADQIWAKRLGIPLERPIYSATVREGARGVAFMFAALESSQNGSRFVRVNYPE